MQQAPHAAAGSLYSLPTMQQAPYAAVGSLYAAAANMWRYCTAGGSV
jgi:hypothetical protein